MILLSHDRYQYDSLILSDQTWAYPRQHLQQLLWCVVSVRLNLPEVEECKLCPLRYYANCVSTTLMVLILHNVESVYFFYSNPVFLWNTIKNHGGGENCFVLLEIFWDIISEILRLGVSSLIMKYTARIFTCYTWLLFLRQSYNYSYYVNLWGFNHKIYPTGIISQDLKKNRTVKIFV